MKTVPEQIEALTVLDTLKTASGEEDLAGEWESSGLANMGKKTTTGWTLTTEEADSGAVWKTPIDIDNGGIAYFELAALPADGQLFELFFANGVGIYVRGGETPAMGGIGVFNKPEFIEEFTYEIAVGEKWAFAWVGESELQIWRKMNGFAWIKAKTIDPREAPFGSRRGGIAYIPKEVAGSAGHIANISFGSLEAGPEPETGLLTYVRVDGEWMKGSSKVLVE